MKGNILHFSAINAIHDSLVELKGEFQLHAELEEEFIHLFIYEKVSGTAKAIELYLSFIGKIHRAFYGL